MSATAWLDAVQRRHPAAGLPLAVIYKFFDDQGSYLAALVTYYALLSLFPLLLLLTAVLGLVLRGDAHLQQQILDSALGQFPVIGNDLGRPGAIGGGTTGVIIGVLGSLYGALGVAQAIQNALNTVWAVPRNHRPNLLTSRLRGLAMLGIAGVALVATTALSAVGASGGSFGAGLGVGFRVLLIGASVGLTTLVFVVGFRVATTARVGVRDVLPGAVAAAVLWQLLQAFGSVYVTSVVRHASATNGVFAAVLGLIAFLYLAASAAVLCAELNCVLARRLYPRALLTPFTDRVQLTRGDRETYTAQAQAQRQKGFEEVDVTFGHPPGEDERGR